MREYLDGCWYQIIEGKEQRVDRLSDIQSDIVNLYYNGRIYETMHVKREIHEVK